MAEHLRPLLMDFLIAAPNNTELVIKLGLHATHLGMNNLIVENREAVSFPRTSG
jgi:hypothetical protein